MRRLISVMLALTLVLATVIPFTALASYADYDYIQHDGYEEYTDYNEYGDDYYSDSDYSDDYDYYDDYEDDYYEDDYLYTEEEASAYGYEEPFNYGKSILTAVVIGLIIALIVTLVLKGQLNNVHKQESANTYVRAGSMNVTESKDLFLYRNIIRTERPKNNSKR